MQLFVGAMGLPSSGRNAICGRFTRHLNVICIDEFDDATLDKIYGSIVKWHFAQHEDAAMQSLDKVGGSGTRVWGVYSGIGRVS